MIAFLNYLTSVSQFIAQYVNPLGHGKKEAKQRGEEVQILPAASEGPQEWPKPNVLSPTTYMGPYGDVFHKNEKKYAKNSASCMVAG